MQNRFSCLAISISVFAFTSCKKVIPVNINDAEKKYVVEGVVTNRQGTCRVLVSQTKNFDDDNNFSGISGAVVTITDNNGKETVLDETSTGVYESASLAGVIGNTYSLKVSIGGQLFTASSTIPPMVNMDSAYITNEAFFRNAKPTVNVQYRDPIGKGNHYRFIQYVNGIKEQKVFVRDDEFSDGNTSVMKLRFEDDDDDHIQGGDIIKVDMLCIDPAVYKYWYSLNQGATGDNNSATPANPVTNISGGALGYFSAHTVQTKTVIAP